MRKFVSEAREIYEDYHHGTFSEKLAKYAISNMRIMDNATKQLKKIVSHDIQDMKKSFADNGINIPDKLIYSAWYLYNMTFADYPKTLTTETQRVFFVKETLLDPDCCPEAVLECYVAKMCCMGEPIHWEEFI